MVTEGLDFNFILTSEEQKNLNELCFYEAVVGKQQFNYALMKFPPPVMQERMG